MDYQKIIHQIAEEAKKELGKGKIANYIPALANIPSDKFGIAIETIKGERYSFGDYDEPFSIQSISKVFTLMMAFTKENTKLWQRVDVEPSGNPFNSLVQLEFEAGIPRNPFINAGALVVTDILLDHYASPKASILDYVRRLSGSDDVYFDYEVAASEREFGYTNTALVNFLKSHKNIHNHIDKVLDVYFHQCSIRMSCQQLAHAFLTLANHGVHPDTKEQILSRSQAKRINAIMLTCGFYDQAGEFAFCVGMPGKSGVGGGIVAVIPEELAIAVWSPELNEHGNSKAGISVLEQFTTLTGLSIF
ncbi:MAG: glutaminase [Chitinophagales bacterium]|nr:glutaminase [Chitinophagales bacterium]